jgi:uncharacterized protein
MNNLIYSDTLPGGKHWSLVMRRGNRLRLTDIEGGANVGMLFYNPVSLTERYSAPDTLKGQHTFKLSQDHCLYSDMGRVFCSIAGDSTGWHDTVCGNTNKSIVAARWGETSYQSHRNDWQQNGLDSFLVEAAKYGMNRRDLAANVNWFTKVTIDDAGSMQFDPQGSFAGASVELQFEMDALVLLHTCPHPLNPAPVYPRKPVGYAIHAGGAASETNPSRISAAENNRGFQNNGLFHLGCCG